MSLRTNFFCTLFFSFSANICEASTVSQRTKNMQAPQRRTAAMVAMTTAQGGMVKSVASTPGSITACNCVVRF